MLNSISSENRLINPAFYAAFSKDKVNVENSSSGGIFYELCEYVIDNGFVVYGAVQKSVLEVEHVRATSLEEATLFRRSKYLKSKLQGCYDQVKEDLEAGRKVLFSGVPCQIAALHRFLEKKYENLFTVEVVCHGAPLTSLYQKYVSMQNEKIGSKMVDICFRDKSQGWKNNSIREYYEDGQEYVVSSSKHLVHALYLRGINMEDRCGSCSYAKLPRVADITLADFWQYKGELFDKSNDRGVSLVVINNDKGSNLWQNIKDGVFSEEVNKESALSSCYHLSHAPRLNQAKRNFIQMMEAKGFPFAIELYSTFGDVIPAEELIQTETVDVNQVFDVLEQDTQEIIYITDEKKVLKGIITFGAFVSAYMKGEDGINYKFGKVVFSENCVNDLKEIFGRSEKILRVPVVDKQGCLLFEVRRTVGGNGRDDARKGLITFFKLRQSKIRCMFFKRPDYLPEFEYTKAQQEQIENKYSFPMLCENIEKLEYILKIIMGNKFSVEYVKELCKISPIIHKGKRYVHADSLQNLVNVIGGMRRTCYQPEKYAMTIHMYGRCGVFGYAVEDADTMPSCLQKELRNQPIRVLNHGIWGADNTKILTNLGVDWKERQIKKDDIVLLYMDYLPYMNELKSLGIEIYDTTEVYHEFLKKGGTFYDRPGHMTAEGYQVVAKYIHHIIGESKVLEKDILLQSEDLEKDILLQSEDLEKQEETLVEENRQAIKDYLLSIKKILPDINFKEKTVGAIVMNCNPFTNGHKYLIETARKQVDILIIFVLEEDKSYFSYKDRMAMVKLGTAEMDNVYVCPSGKFMISALTFPEYFLKEQQQEVVINPAKDVEIFGKYIAPEFHVTKRFVGTEPVDNVTNQYNEALKKMLPEYGIELVEILRLKFREKYISATVVRNAVRTNQYKELEDLVPESTLMYLQNELEG